VTDVVVVAPVRVHRESLAAALDAVGDLSVVAEVATLEEALEQLREREGRAVALLDNPLLGDLLLAAPLATEPEAKLVALGVPDNEALAWIEAGAAGSVPPDGSLEEVIAAVRKVAVDELAASPQVTAHLAKRVRRLATEVPSSSAEERLTSREVEVLDLLGEGLSNKQIAARLCIELPTVKNHVHSILEKLAVGRRSEAVAWLHGQLPAREIQSV
jgi:two-component system, NarL family, nitrate/nitrite response regulator NarL